MIENELKNISADIRERGITLDAFLGGKLNIFQPKRGYRAAMDPVLLAAAAPDVGSGKVLDVGCGVGTASLCYLNRNPIAKVDGLEIQADLAELAKVNATHNGHENNMSVIVGDLSDVSADLVPSNSYDLVMTNPPYMMAHKSQASPDHIRQIANVESHVTLPDWIDFCLKKLKQKGVFVMVQRADRVDEIIASLQNRLGEICIIPLWPREGENAKRVIIRGRKAVKGGAIIHPGLILHESKKRYSHTAEAVLKDGQAID